jgi:predicted Zn-dependent protease
MTQARFNLAISLLRTGQAGAAITELERYTAASPDDPRGYSALAEALEKEGRHAEAEAARQHSRGTP